MATRASVTKTMYWRVSICNEGPRLCHRYRPVYTMARCWGERGAYLMRGGMRMRDTRSTVLAALAAALLLLLPARAQDRPDASRGSHLNRILDTGTMRVGTTGDFPPITSRDPETKNYVGYDIDAAAELAKDLGVKLQFVQADWKTLVNGIIADKYD